MIARRFILLLAVSAMAVGCRVNDPSVDLLEVEIRWLEDQLYAMEDEISLRQAQLDSCRRENAALRKEVNGDASPTSKLAPRRSSPPSSDNLPDLPNIEIPGAQGQPDVDFGTPAMPDIDLGTPAEPGQELGDPLPGGAAGGAARESKKPGPAKSSGRDLPPREAGQGVAGDGGQAAVERIVLNQQLTGGKDFDGAAGDDGILVVVEPQDASGNYVATPGAVSVVVLDPRKTGQAAYVGRWNFDVADAVERMRETLLGRGIYLELPWPNQPPEQSQLRLYVRYMTTDGRKLDVQKQIAVDVPQLGSTRPANTSDVGSRPSDPSRDLSAAEDRTLAPPNNGNPLRSNGSGNTQDETGGVASGSNATAFLPPNHDPNELAPLWNGGDTAVAAGDRSVLVPGGDSASENGRENSGAQQALRARPWAPSR